MKREITVFLTAVMFFTRIPCPKQIDHSQDILNESARYYPVIGWIVGGAAALVFTLAHLIFPLSVSILFSMTASILITGAFHEDGFADTCDGLGGGWEKGQILDIMKDSRIGTYGAIGLVLILLCKFLALSEIPSFFIPVVLIIGHSLSRFISSLFRFTYSYVRENDDSKVKPMAKEMSVKNLILSAVFGLLPLSLLNNFFVLVLVLPVLVTEFLFARYVVKRIGGYTGDCLGAIQQLCEVVFYLSFIVFLKFTTALI